MNIEEIRNFCLAKKGVEETFPFDNETLVFKVMNKMFLLINVNSPDSMNLKCDPEYAIELREQYSEIIAGYHMSKKHWNTVSLTGNLDKKLLIELIGHSYLLVVNGLSKKERAVLSDM